MKGKIISVNGFLFNDPAVGEEALREQEAVAYIQQQMNMNSPENVLEIYTQMIHRNLFHTQVGYDFLKSMQNYLYSVASIDPATIEDIPIEVAEGKNAEVNEMLLNKKAKELAENMQKEEKKKEQQSKRDRKKDRKNAATEETKVPKKTYKTAFFVSSVTSGILLLVVILMFLITLSSNNPNIFNYETKIQNKYASWEQELDAREEELAKREIKLRKEEANIKDQSNDAGGDL